MAVQGNDVRQLLLQVDASVELAKRNLNSLQQQVAVDAAKMDKSLGSIDGAMARAGAAAGKFKVALGGLVAGIGVGTIVNIGKSILSFADDLEAAADQAGIGIERYQTLKEALRSLEVEGNKADKIFQVLGTTLGDVQNNADNAATKALERLGIASKITSGEITTTDQLIDALATSATSAGTQFQFTSDIVDILGKKLGVEFANAIKDGGVALAEFERQMRESGTVVDEALIQKLADANEAIAAFQETMKRELVLAAGHAFEFAEDAKLAVNTLFGLFEPLTADWGATLTAFFGGAAKGFTNLSTGISSVLGLVDEAANLARGIDNRWENFWEDQTFGLYKATPKARSNLRGQFDRNLATAKIMAGDPLADFGGARSGKGRTLQTAGQQRDAARAKSAGRGRTPKATKKEPTAAELRDKFWMDLEPTVAPGFGHFSEALPEIEGAVVDLDKAMAELVGKIDFLTTADLSDMLKAEDAERLRDFAQDFNRDLAGGLADALVYGENLGDVLENTFRRAAAALIESGIMQLLAPGSDGGGIFRGVVSSLSGLFGGGRASGGPVSPSKFYRVGERGPEIFVPRVPGTIIPNHALGGGSDVIRVEVDKSALFDVHVTRISAGTIAAAAPAIQRATVRSLTRPRL